MELQTLYFGDEEAVMKYGDAAYWASLAKGQLSYAFSSSQTSTSSEDDNTSEETSLAHLDPNLANQITTKGFHVLPSPKHNKYSPVAFTSTLKALADAGWPPQFLLMYDETWQLLRDSVHQITGDSNVTIESDVNVWSLHRNDPPGSYIGGNFVGPHRDMTFDACHDDDEQPTSLSVWIPLNQCGATEFNGCMRCLPIESDDFFYCPLHPRHSTNSHYTDDDAEKLVVEQFGCAIWDPSTVHWGGSYEPERCEEEPRASLAFTICLGSKAANFGTAASRIPGSSSLKQADQTGPTACLVKDCDRGGNKRRVQVVAKGLLSYSHHWPGFPCPGFLENLKLSKLAFAKEGKAVTCTDDNLHSLLKDGAHGDNFRDMAQEKVLLELNSLYEEYTFATAKDASLTDDLRRRASTDTGDHHSEDSLVYGEIDLRGFCDLLMNDIPHDSSDIFYDLGSGSGKAVFAARFVGDFRQCFGIELLSNLHDMASSVASLYKFLYQNKLIHQDIKFVCSDLLDYDGWWKDGTVVYVPNLLFDDNLKDQIAEKAVRMKTGVYLICLKKFNNTAFNAVFDLIKERPVAMSWGESNVYIYQRK
jgi:hypothetical protein